MKFILPILVGALIGYFTNWLAIKMLFRPHKEIRIFGIPVPFTPGLIPKERARMAETVGQTVGTHLLSSDIIVNALSSTKINNQIEIWLEEKINELKKSNKLIKDALSDVFNNRCSEIINTVEDKIRILICNQLKNEKFKAKIVEIIINEVFNKLDENTYRDLKEKAQQYIYHLSSKPEIKDGLKNIIDIKLKELENDSRQFNEILPSNLSDSISIYLDEHSDKVSEFIKDVIKNESVAEKLKTGTIEIVKQNVSSVITMFISPDSIADKVLDSIQEYITLEENKANVTSTIKIIVDKLLSTKMNDIIRALSEEDKEKTLDYILDVASGYLVNKQNQEKIFDVIEQSIRNNEKDIKDKVQNLIMSRLDGVVESQGFVNYISKVVKDIIHDVLSKPISAIFESFDVSAANGMTKLIMNVINVFVRTKSPSIIEMLNIPKLVERQINSFDVEFAEKLIIEIANKELKAITWFGAVLGGLIGILTPILQYFY